MRALRVGFLASALAFSLAACNGSSSSPSFTAAGGSSGGNSYPFLADISIPGVPIPASSSTFSFDISWIDATKGEYYLADRTTGGIDVVNLASLAYVGTAGAGSFQGVKAAIGGAFARAVSGPNGLLSIGNGVLYTGDGDATTKVVSLAGGLIANIPDVNPITAIGASNTATTITAATIATIAAGGVACDAGKPTVGGATAANPTPSGGSPNGRADELAYDPTDGIVFMVQDNSCPPYGVFISTATNTIVGSVAFGGGNAQGTIATGGAEQPVWDPTQKKFLLALPSTVVNPQGEIEVIDPKTFQITGIIAEPANCNANGLALGPNENLFLGCASGTLPQVLYVINAVTGAVVSKINGLGGGDEVWYNPTANRFYCACSNNAAIQGGPVIPVLDGTTGALLNIVGSGAGAHSIAVDPGKDRIFSPQRANSFGGPVVFGR